MEKREMTQSGKITVKKNIEMNDLLVLDEKKRKELMKFIRLGERLSKFFYQNNKSIKDMEGYFGELVYWFTDVKK